MNRLLFLLVCFSFITACNSDTKNTERILGFPPPSSIKKVDRDRESNYNPTGDGILYVEYIFSNSDTTKLIEGCLKNGFLKLPINEKMLTDGAIFQYISRDNNKGYYKLNIGKDGMSYSIAVIDLSNNKIYIYEALY